MRTLLFRTGDDCERILAPAITFTVGGYQIPPPPSPILLLTPKPSPIIREQGNVLLPLPLFMERAASSADELTPVTFTRHARNEAPLRSVAVMRAAIYLLLKNVKAYLRAKDSVYILERR